jgi:ATP-dependent exoDNAse (exonuclease V) alpha subunit
MQLTEEQLNVQDEVLDWYRSRYSNVIKIVGYAGTGKTTLMTEIASKIRYNKDLGRRGAHRIAFCAFTGKAAFVLESKLEENGSITAVDYVGTIHGLLYSPRYKRKDGKKIIIGWSLRKELDVDLIIVDEGSMVYEEIWQDLLHYNIPIIVCGDHGQLPPVGPKFDLLANADFQLKEIHRQALDNPIIKLTLDIRRYGFIKPGIFNESVFKLDWYNQQTKDIYDKIDWASEDKDIIQLCGFNKTRVGLNNKIREKLDYTLPNPYPAERVICLKNNHNSGIKNGQLGSLVWVYNAGDDLYDLTLRMDGFGDDLHSSLAIRSSFGKDNYNDEMEIDFKRTYAKEMKRYDQKDIDMFDFGYATTVHKSQGSEWNKVVLFEQRNRYQDDQEYARWLYTAATRAKEKLFIIYNYWG